MQRDMYDPNEIFLEYQKEIAKNPIYAGMPDLHCDNGSIQWEAPSNRGSGKFKDTHDKRLKWWKDKATSVGIDTRINQWISKTAKLIHPTKLRPCKKCGRLMDIRYIYLSGNLIKRVLKPEYVPHDFSIDELTSVFELCTMLYNSFWEKIFDDIPALLSCKQFPSIPKFPDLNRLNTWLENTYVPAEPSTLGPGAMSNAPDRLDGFHSFNRCCRKTADKGRTKDNLASYSTDRRAFEFWSDGNWITANHLMGMIASSPELMKIPCFRSAEGGIHSLPCSADHIGPISLGFVHRPTFQLLCKSCNSAKNNRMYLSDIKSLIDAEQKGETVVSWYAKPIWDILKVRVKTIEDALKLSRIMRDNRFNALLLLGQFLEKNELIFLSGLLNLHYADFDYIEPSLSYDKSHIVSAKFVSQKSSTRFVAIQKGRKLRIAYSALAEYLSKGKRNGLSVDIEKNHKLFNDCISTLFPLDRRYDGFIAALAQAISHAETTDAVFEKLAMAVPDVSREQSFLKAKSLAIEIMTTISQKLAAQWNADRYKRD